MAYKPRLTLAQLLLLTTVAALTVQWIRERATVSQLQEELAAHDAVQQLRTRVEQRRLEWEAAKAVEAPYQDWQALLGLGSNESHTSSQSTTYHGYQLTVPTGAQHQKAVIRNAELRWENAKLELQASEDALQLRIAKRKDRQDRKEPQ